MSCCVSWFDWTAGVKTYNQPPVNLKRFIFSIEGAAEEATNQPPTTH